MDNYPTKFAPEFDKTGAVKTPFDQWWKHAKAGFTNVPEEAAKEWLHRHWGHSLWSWIPSKKYKFKLENIHSSDLQLILTTWSDFKLDNTPAREQGAFICGENPDRPWPHDEIWLASYMKENGDFPSPIIILDNTDNHLRESENAPEYDKKLPPELILVEGHTRFNIALHLVETKRFNEQTQIYRLVKL